MTFTLYGRGTDPDAILVREYRLSDMDSTGQPTESNPHYFGYVNLHCQWYIMKLTDKSARYTRGGEDYEANWENRESLTYYNFQYVF